MPHPGSKTLYNIYFAFKKRKEQLKFQITDATTYYAKTPGLGVYALVSTRHYLKESSISTTQIAQTFRQ